MKIADKIQINNTEYMCTQIIDLKELTVYRVHELTGEKGLFIMNENNEYKEVTDENVLKEICDLLGERKTDVVIKVNE